MNKNILLVILVIALAGVVSIYLWGSNNRYYMITNKAGHVYQLDKKTGNTWRMKYGVKIPIKEYEENNKIKEDIPIKILNADSLSLVTGYGSLRKRSGYFSGEIYNGSKWTLKKLVIVISANEIKEEEKEYESEFGKILDDILSDWERSFSVDVNIKPLSSGKFMFDVAGARRVKESNWIIKEAYGYIE